MKIKSLIIAAAAVAALAMPSVASAADCPVGIMNEVSVVPPATLAEGQTQNQHYTVTACTVTAKVTVEWVKIIASYRPWLTDPSNRTTIIPETSMGTAMDGRTSWTIPAGTPDGHYAVITRYYSTRYTTPEAQAGSSFSLATPDMCSNIAGNQQTIPAGLVQDGTECVADVCSNIAGVQRTVPSGLVQDGTECVADVCSNLTGVQRTVPAGLVQDGTECVADMCSNIAGVQRTVPVGLVQDGTECVADVCSNIAGVQRTVPVGLVQSGTECVTDVCTNLTGIQTSVPAGYVLFDGTCILPPVVVTTPVVTTPPPLVDVCANIDGLQIAVPDGYTLVAGTCTIIAAPTGTPPTPLLPTPWIIKTANKHNVTTGDAVLFTIRMGNNGPGTLKDAVTCDRLPAGTTYVSNTGSGAFANGSMCWNLGNMAKGTSKTVTLTLKISASFKGKVLRNTACMTSMNANKVCSTAKVTVHTVKPQPIGGVTG